MDTPTVTRSTRLPHPAPTGLWKVLCIIAERLPPHQLIWFALLVCCSGLGFVVITCVSIGRAASMPAKALAEYIERHTRAEPTDALAPPRPPT